MADDIKQEFYPLQGGLDTMTPAITLDAGKCFDAQNYEPVIDGGYGRINGFERFDGQASPSAASYWTLGIARTGTINVGDVVTGGTSGASGHVLGIFASYLVLGRLLGTFVVGEVVLDAGSVGTVTAITSQGGAPNPSDDADYALLAANDWRQFILPVPGSGPIRGIWYFNGNWYAFRDNAAGTGGGMYVATAGSWSLVIFGYELLFNSGLAAGATLAVGNTIKGVTSGATATVAAILVMTGSWGFSAIGSFTLTGIVGTFALGESIELGTTVIATAAAASSQITRQPGGKMEFYNYNFTGLSTGLKMYGVDGVNNCFEWDGTNYTRIHTGMAIDAPTHVIGHKDSLFLSFFGTIQFSGIGQPYSWTVNTGAGSIAVNDPVSGWLPQGGSYVTGSTLAIFTNNGMNGRTDILYGTSAADFKLVESIFDIGYSPFTMQNVSNNAYGMTARGIQSLVTTLTYGDFDYASISHEIQSFINQHRGLEISSCAPKAKNQYRVFYSDGYGLAVGLTGDKISAIMPLNYGLAVRCIATATVASGQEVTMFGSDSGYIYQDSTGTSFDGNPIEAWVRLPFNHSKSPRTRKRYRRLIIEGKITSYARVNISYDLGYGNANVAIPALVNAVSTGPTPVSGPVPAGMTELIGGGGYWDQFTWDQFVWDAQIIGTPVVALEGTEKNISFLFYSNRAQDQPHTLQGLTLCYSNRRADRS